MATQQTLALRLALRRYGRQMLAHKRVVLPAMLLPALGNIFILYLPSVVIGQLAARYVAHPHQPVSVLWRYVALYVGTQALGEVLWRVGMHCLNRTDGYGIEDLYVSGMAELMARDAAFFHDNFAGALTKRVVGYASRYEVFIDTLSFSVVANLLPLGFACVLLWQYDPRLVAVLLGVLVVTGCMVVPLIRRRQSLVDAREAAWANVSGHVADTLANMDAVRAFGAEQREHRDHRDRVAEQRQLAIRSWDYGNLRIDTLVSPMSIVGNALGLVVALSAGGGPGQVARLVVTFGFFSQATRILFDFNRTYRNMESALTEAAQFTILLLDPPQVVDQPLTEPLAPADASVRFEHVTFSYGGGPPLFRDLTLKVSSGERVGLVGRSGGGKTTLTRLVLRLMDIDAGRILVGGQDISQLPQVELRGLVAYVPQDPAMFHRTLRENIAFGRPDASLDEVLAAAEAAHVTAFLPDLPDGLDTLVGERGVKLSGGQRQRVAIARAILRDAPILLLDEATSALDSESEAHIQQALWRVMQGRTAIVVAHRLSTVARLDRLVVLDSGRVVEDGPHEELLRSGGTYASLWARQSGGFLAGAAT